MKMPTTTIEWSVQVSITTPHKPFLIISDLASGYGLDWKIEPHEAVRLANALIKAARICQENTQST